MIIDAGPTALPLQIGNHSRKMVSVNFPRLIRETNIILGDIINIDVFLIDEMEWY